MAVENRTAASRTAAEGRWARRRSICSAGLILFPNAHGSIPCLVKDASSTGARLEVCKTRSNSLGASNDVPSQFTLIMRFDHVEVDCKIVWRRDAEIGVRFLGATRPLSKKRLQNKPLQKKKSK